MPYTVRFLSTGPPPPTPPWLWHSTHDRALNTGPSPSPEARGSFGVHSWRNSVSPDAAARALTLSGPDRLAHSMSFHAGAKASNRATQWPGLEGKRATMADLRRRM